MKWLLWICLITGPILLHAQPVSPVNVKRWKEAANRVSIVRDHWGIPHVYGRSDADAVFGLMYAQAEDDYPRIEWNYIEKLGRLSEVNGLPDLYNDLYVQLIIDTTDAKADYEQAPGWLKQLLNAWADGLNYYLYKHPQQPRLLLHHYEPWYPLLWTDGSIGAVNTGSVTESDVEALFAGTETSWHAPLRDFDQMNTGSNGFAIAPQKSANGHAMLYINPHVTFYFRPEVHMVSEEGLQAYGAVTWGQFFVYQGFNAYCGWMHTSSNVDVADNYLLTTRESNGLIEYWYDNKWLPVRTEEKRLMVKSPSGWLPKVFHAMYTHLGPVMAKWDGKYVAVKSMNRSVNSLVQSWERTKAHGLADFKRIMQYRSNTSNNTVFADRQGNIAYWHGNFVPKRDPKINWGKPVDGTRSAFAWNGLHALSEMIHVINPYSGFIQNCNSTPFTVSGPSSPQRADYPAYMAPDGENFRGLLASKLLQQARNYTLDSLMVTGYNTRMLFFETMIPALIQRYDEQLVLSDSMYDLLKAPMDVLRNWDCRAAEHSVATTLAIEWAERLPARLKKVYVDEGEPSQVDVVRQFAHDASVNDLLLPLTEAVQFLEHTQGSWQIPWGEINRIQRISNTRKPVFSDTARSYPIAFSSAIWGTLPAYVSRYFEGTRKRYGVSGNSFVCAVEFGPKVTAYSLLAGGESGNQKSVHFRDQLEPYSKGHFKKVLFYEEDVFRNMKRAYRPGDE